VIPSLPVHVRLAGFAFPLRRPVGANWDLRGCDDVPRARELSEMASVHDPG